MSSHKIEIIKVHLDPHPNADTLSVVRAFGWTSCVRTADWQEGQLAAFVPPDSLVDVERPEFYFLRNESRVSDTKVRIKARKFRGVPSFGLLVPAPAGFSEGDDAAEALGVTHYEPPERFNTCQTRGVDAPSPSGFVPVYDMENIRRYSHCFNPGEPVVVTEKIHGSNGRWLYDGANMHVGSHRRWKKNIPGDLWWSIENSEIFDFCRRHTGLVVYGEVYGPVQDLTYGVPRGHSPKVAVFDIWDMQNGCWLDVDALDAYHYLPMVPTLYRGPFDLEALCALAEGPSTMPGAKHVREGCVVRPLKERTHVEIGRVIGKLVGLGYLNR